MFADHGTLCFFGNLSSHVQVFQVVVIGDVALGTSHPFFTSGAPGLWLLILLLGPGPLIGFLFGGSWGLGLGLGWKVRGFTLFFFFLVFINAVLLVKVFQFGPVELVTDLHPLLSDRRLQVVQAEVGYLRIRGPSGGGRS